MGLAISKKCAPKAVQRNRIKRIIRESFRHNQNSLRGLDLVIVGHNRPNQSEQSLLVRSLLEHWRVVSERCANF